MNNIDLFTLPNGLRVAAERLPHLRTVSMGVWVKVGSMYEKPFENGLSHFMEHMAFKGTERRTAKDIAVEMDAVGGQMNAFTGRDCTCYYAKVIDENVELAFDLLSDMVCHATLDAEAMDKERTVILEEIAIDEDAPEDLVADLLTEVQFKGQQIGQPIMGSAAQVSAYTRQQLVDFRSTHYSPDRAVISVCGNYDPAQLRELAEKYFVDWQQSGEAVEAGLITVSHGQHITREKDIEQMHICLGYPGCSYAGKDLYTLALLSTVLGGSDSSRLFQRIREELGMAYSVYSFTNSYMGGGTFDFYAGVNPANAQQTLDEMLKVIGDVARNSITEKEYLGARTMLRAGYLMGLESSGSRMQEMGRLMLLTGKPSDHEKALQDIEAVTREDVAEVAGRLLTAIPSLAVVGRGAEGIKL